MQASHKARRGTRTVRSNTLAVRENARLILTQAVKPVFELLEQRQLMTTVWVNDNWFVTNDQGSVGVLDSGDTVDNSGSGDSGSVTGKIYGTNAFSTISDAQAAISNGDKIHVISGLYTSGPTTITKEITVEGDNTGVDGAGSRAPEAVIGASGGGLIISANNVTVDGVKISDAASGNAGVAISSGASNVTISHNIITNNSVGVVVNAGAGNFIVSDNLISGNNRAGATTGQGVSVGANTGTGSILRNTINSHTNGSSTAGINLVGSSSVTIGTAGNGNTFNSNTVALRSSGATTGTSLVGNTFAGTNTTYIDRNVSGELDASSNTYNGVNPSGNSANLAQQNAIEDKIVDGIDASGRGLVRIDPGHVYVTAASEAMNAGSISRAVALASATNIVHVGAGTFVDQVTINKALTLIGVGNTTVVRPIASLATLFTTAETNKPIIYATGSNSIDIKQLKVDGNGQGNGNNRFMGIAYYNGAGTVDNVTVTAIRNTPFDGFESAGIYAYSDDLAARTIHITNNTVSDYQKIGILAVGDNLTFDITGNTVTGPGAVTALAPNGVEVGFGSTGTIANNIISGHMYNGTMSGADPLTSVQSAGIILLDTTGTVTVSGNTINGNDIGLYNRGNATLSGNTFGNVTANRYEGVFVDQGTTTLTSNTITGGAMGVAVYSFNGNTGNSVATITGGTITSTTGVQVFDDDLLGDVYKPVATVSGVNAAGTGGTGYGVNVDGGKAMIQNSNLSGHLVGLRVASGANVDAGSNVGDSNPTGLGTSAGNNDISGYTGTGGSYAIQNLNVLANSDPNVYARNNNFGNPVTPVIVEGRIFDDSDDATRTQVIFADPQNLASPANQVWVDDDWASVVPGNDADGAGANGSVFGIDQFSTIQDAINAVANNGIIRVAAGTYVENASLNKQVQMLGARAGTDARNRFTGAPPATESVITAASNGSPALDLVTGAAGSIINGFAFYGGAIQMQASSGPLDNLQVLNNSFSNFTGSGIVLLAAGRNMVFDKNSLDGTAQTGSAAQFSMGTNLYDGLFITNNFIRNGGANNTGLFVDGDHNIIPSIGIGGRNPVITGNNISFNNIGINLGARSFQGGTISSNTVRSNDLDGFQGGPQNATISQNSFDTNGRYGMNLTSFGNAGATYGAQNNNITNNMMYRNGTAELILDSGQAPGSISTNHINQNSFGLPSSAPASITLTAAPTVTYGGSETIDLTLNWWNNVAGPTGGGHIGGPGSAVLTGAGAANLDVAPWIRASTDTGNNFNNGFQPDLNQVGHDAITLSGGVAVNEGSPYTLTYAYNGDTDLSAVTSLVINWGDGTSSTIVGAPANGTATHTYADSPNPVQVTVNPSTTQLQLGPQPTIQMFAVDPVKTYGIFPVKPVTVNNVAPTLANSSFVSVSGTVTTTLTSVNEQATATIQVGAVTDPGSENISLYRINWGDGTSTIVTNASLNLANRRQTHVYTDDNPSGTSIDPYTISIDVQDEDSVLLNAPGGYYLNAGTGTVNVANVNPAPTVLPAPATATVVPTIAEGSNNTLTFQTGDPAGALETYTYSWSITKDGNPFASNSISIGTAIPNFNFVPSDNGTYVVNFSVKDDDGGVANAATPRTFVATNMPPVPTITPATVSEGGTATLGVTTGDPGSADTFSYAWTISQVTGTITNTISTGTNSTIPLATPNSGPVYVVNVTVTDDDHATLGNGQASTTRTITIQNLAPSVTIVGAPTTTINEGSSFSLTSSVTDPGGDAIASYAWTSTKVSGTVTTTVASATTSNFLFNPTSFGTFVIRLTATDTDATPLTGTAAPQTVTVLNVAPTPTIVGGPTAAVGEGSTVSLNSSNNDPGSGDTFVYTWTVTKNGNPYTSVVVTNAGFNLVPNDNAVYVVSMTMNDGAVTATPANSPITFTATNVNPNPTISGTPVAEGTTQTLTAVPGDPGSLDTFTYQWSVTRNGVPFGTTSTASTFTFLPDDNTPTWVVSLGVTDNNGGVGNVTRTVAITDANPTITLSGTTAINEGQTATVTFGAITDPAGANDTISQYRVVWGDGTDTGFVAGTPTGTLTHRYDDGATPASTRTLTVEIVDEDGLHAAGTRNITVSNVNPTGLFSGSTPVNLGDNGTVIWATHSDPSNDDNANLVYDYDFNNDGTYEIVGSLSPSATVPAAFLTGTPPTKIIKSQIRDNDGGSFVQTFSIVVNSASFRVINFNQSNSGFSVQFNKPVVTTGLNLYDGNDASVDATDVVVMRTGSPNPIAGSLVWDGTTNTATWVATGGVLPNDTYSLTLVSGATAWVATAATGGDALELSSTLGS